MIHDLDKLTAQINTFRQLKGTGRNELKLRSFTGLNTSQIMVPRIKFDEITLGEVTAFALGGIGWQGATKTMPLINRL